MLTGMKLLCVQQLMQFVAALSLQIPRQNAGSEQLTLLLRIREIMFSSLRKEKLYGLPRPLKANAK
jgi:hypothetical protein